MWKNKTFLAINFYEVHNLVLIYILQTCKKTVDFITGFDTVTSLQGCYSYIIPINVDLSNDTTMLQKLSKCEVKAWLCWYLIILPPPRFYVRSNFAEFKRSKNVVFGNFRGSEFWFLVNLSNFQVPNLPKFNVSKIALNDIFGLSKSAKLWF